VPIKESLADLKWQGATSTLKKVCLELGDTRIPERIKKWK